MLAGYNGLQTIILESGRTDVSGRAKLDLSKSGYRGIAKLYFSNESGIELILNGENVDIFEQKGVVYYTGQENNLLLGYLSGHCNMNDIDNHFYARSIINIYAFLRKIRTSKTIEDRMNARTFFVQDLNVDDLYFSGLWDSIISEMFALFRVDERQYHIVIMSLLDRASKKEVFEQLIWNSILHCENSGWDDVEQKILDRFFDFTQIFGYSKKMEVFHNLGLRRVGRYYGSRFICNTNSVSQGNIDILWIKLWLLQTGNDSSYK